MSTLEDALVSKARAVRRVRQQLALESALQVLPVPRVRAIDPQEDEVHRLGERRAVEAASGCRMLWHGGRSLLAENRGGQRVTNDEEDHRDRHAQAARLLAEEQLEQVLALGEAAAGRERSWWQLRHVGGLVRIRLVGGWGNTHGGGGGGAGTAPAPAPAQAFTQLNLT